MKALIEKLVAKPSPTAPARLSREKRFGSDDPENSRVAVLSPEPSGNFTVYFGFEDPHRRSGQQIRISHSKGSKLYKSEKTAMRAITNWIEKRK